MGVLFFIISYFPLREVKDGTTKDTKSTKEKKISSSCSSCPSWFLIKKRTPIFSIEIFMGVLFFFLFQLRNLWMSYSSPSFSQSRYLWVSYFSVSVEKFMGVLFFSYSPLREVKDGTTKDTKSTKEKKISSSCSSCPSWFHPKAIDNGGISLMFTLRFFFNLEPFRFKICQPLSHTQAR